MSELVTLMHQYIRLRQLGRNREDAFHFLRPHLEALPPALRQELARKVSRFEGDEFAAEPPGVDATLLTPKLPPRMGSIKPLRNPPRPPSIACPRCTHFNSEEEFFCTRCGYFLQTDTQAFETMRLIDGSIPPVDEYFDPNAALLITISETRQYLTVRPQALKHELIVGRADGHRLPDIDLTPMQGAELGVSRQHLSIMHQPQHHTLVVSDLNSANGTFINGQRLYPNETRTLRQSDEIRLGRLVLRVGFRVG